MSKTTSSLQYQKLEALLEENPDIAQGFSKRGKEFIDIFWKNCENELNRIGPPTKDVNAWRKGWKDYKSYIKKKLSHNKREVNATGGGPNRIHVFTATEETVIRITGMSKSIDGIPGAQRFGMTSQTVAQEERVTQEDSENVSIGPRVASTPRRRRPESNVAELLKTQIEIQKELNTNIKRVYRGIYKMYEVQKENINERKRHNKVIEDLTREKIVINKKILEIQNNVLI